VNEFSVVMAEPSSKRDYNLSDIATRAQAVILRSNSTLTNRQIEEITTVQERNIRRLVKRAKERGWTPDSPLLDKHVEDGKRPGRPPKTTQEMEQQVLAYVRQSKATRSYNLKQIAEGAGVPIGRELVRKILHKHRFKKVKRTAKPGLTAVQKEARLEWCLKHQFIDWSKVVFSDETSVILGHRRGGDKVWRQPEEVNNPTCRKTRGSGYMTFMFWGCFSYDWKGPCFIWPGEETAAEKAEAIKQLEELNQQREEPCRQEWLLANGLRRVNIARPGKTPGKPPEWKWNKAHGKWAREKGKGGIDWWRYRVNVLEPLLIPFAKEHGLTIQEDGASCHIHEANQQLIRDSGIPRLDWPGNSPDLNMIEPAWPKMKRDSQTYENWEKKAQLSGIWMKVWKALQQDQIRAWIDRIPRHIRKVIELNGGNDYREGRMDRRSKGQAFTSAITGGLERVLNKPDSANAAPSSVEGSGSSNSGDSNNSDSSFDDWFMHIDDPTDEESEINEIEQ
jgi:transposase